jgi:hypothetical protein
MEKVRRHTLVFLDFYIFPALISVVSPDPEELKFDVCIQLESPFDSLAGSGDESHIVTTQDYIPHIGFYCLWFLKRH